eukprot:TRINITY_DN160_c0_g3_i1.p1 TRINITY_DN160_c0_g3~~TRINITY_DN160_c0_g3_i1.p1  ORF type:complete len:668 (+),score=195.81 TRINITY_DN160_c0_g3_i1:46-2049(+)
MMDNKLLIFAFTVLLAISQTTSQKFQDIDADVAKQVLAAMDWNVDPCHNFYNFSCGTWMKETVIPADQSRVVKSFTPIANKNLEILRDLLNSSLPEPFDKINNFYDSCMDQQAIDNAGIDPVKPYVSLAQNVPNLSILMETIGKLHSIGVNAFFSVFVERDEKNPDVNIAYFGQGGLLLPDKSFYDDDDLVKKYSLHISKMASILGFSNPKSIADSVITLEKEIASVTIPNNELVDPFKVYNRMNISTLVDITNLNWDAYLQGIEIDDIGEFSVSAPKYYEQVAKVITQNQKNWGNYLVFHVVHSFASYMPSKIAEENFNFFEKILRGQEKETPRWKICVQETDNALPELTGFQYAKIAFPGESRSSAEHLLDAIENAMEEDLEHIKWMDNETRAKAIDKLHKVANMIGFPADPDTYPEQQPRSKQYLQNQLDYRISSRREMFNDIGKLSDRYKWGMSADTVNAYYDPTRNEMVFPAGILQSTFFNVSYPTSMNYGGIGMVMGHELSHGFDNQGRDYNGEGVLIDWWGKETSHKFDEKVKCVIDQYDKFEILPGVYVDGKLTQGENIADMGGIKLSFNAYLEEAGSTAFEESIVPKLTNEQLYFVSFAQNWCGKVRPSTARVLAKTDPHSPSQFRVMGPLINLEQFGDVFNCPVGSTMNPEERCEVW